MTVEEQYSIYKEVVDAYLENRFPPKDCGWQTVFKAMNYSLLSPGKRVRPCLTLAFAELCGGDVMLTLPVAAACEMVHCYSLIHDDLPAMDNDDLRRGKPTNHKVFGDAMAILAGDALLTAAFSTALSAPLPPDRLAKAAALLAAGAGENGMIAGQVLDIEGEGKKLTVEQLQQLCLLKTGALIQTACCLGVAAAGGDETMMAAARTYGAHLGLAFQIQDDILDIEGSTALLGKTVGSDAQNEKCTFASLLGVEKCRELVSEHSRLAREAVPMAGGEFLRWFAGKLQSRRK